MQSMYRDNTGYSEARSQGCNGRRILLSPTSFLPPGESARNESADLRRRIPGSKSACHFISEHSPPHVSNDAKRVPYAVEKCGKEGYDVSRLIVADTAVGVKSYCQVSGPTPRPVLGNQQRHPQQDDHRAACQR